MKKTIAILRPVLCVLLLLCMLLQCGCGRKPSVVPVEPTADPSAQQTEQGGEPAAPTEAAPTEPPAGFALRISEVVNGPSGWAELENMSGEAVRLSSYFLSDKANAPDKWRLPDVDLEPHSLVVIELTGAGGDPYTATFKLGRSESQLFLFNDRGELADRMDLDPAMPEGVSAVMAEGGTAYTSHVTKGEPNSNDTFTTIEWTPLDLSSAEVQLYINEVLSDNKYGIVDSFGDRSDWAELLNPTDGPVNLSDYYLSDNPAEPLKYRLPDIEVAPHSYAVIFLSGRESAETEGEIHVPFKLSGGESIVLSCINGMKQDLIEIPEDISPNISVGRNGNNEIRYYSAPTPGAPNSSYGLENYADAGGFNAASLYISEVCAVTPARSGGSDWVELYNGSAETMALDGWRMTDDIDEPDKYIFSGSLKSGGYLVITCEEGKRGTYRADFSVSNTGDTIYLIDDHGAVRDVFETGVTELGMTSGREAGTKDGARRLFASATKGWRNDAPIAGMAAEPTFSTTALFHSSQFSLEIRCATPGAEIHYTTDGSVPTISSALYSGPISISKNTVISAKAFLSGWASSPTAFSTYVIGDTRSLPVVCLSMSKSDYSRMYVAESTAGGGVKKGDEVPCRMEYYVNGRLAIATGAGVRVSGASTSLYSQKPLGIYFRAGYGRSSVDFPFFEGCKTTNFRSLTLRNGGQDAPNAHIRDAYMSRVCQGLNLDVAYVQPVVVYINGEYRGIYDLKENMNEDYVASHHGVDRETVEIARRNGKMIAGTKDQWTKMFSMCSSLDFSKQENFDKLAKLVDVECVMDYLIARTYFYDWDMYNQKYWHTNDDRVKWRPVFYDSDYALYGNNVNGSNLAQYFNKNGVSSAHGFITKMDIFCALNQNKAWRDAFITRYIYVVKYRFNKDRALRLYDELVNEYKPEIRDQISRWHMPSSYDKWTSEVSALRSCIEKRPAAALKILKKYYGLSDSQFAEYEKAADAMAGN